MKKSYYYFLLTLFIAATSFIVVDTWKVDKAHAEVVFEVTHLGISEVSGHFKDFDIEIQTNKEDFTDAVFKFSAKVASIDTRVKMRDDHLKSPDFFDAEKYPSIDFVSTAVKKKGKDELEVTGNLTMHGITKEVKLEVKYNGMVENAMNKKMTAGFKADGKIKRSDFNIGAKFPPPMISDEVEIEINGEFTR
ncbi:YceI family protein [Gynurincola endophyticus]|uniref:YceI family protein n=1 Tax=Gynurincola endophyticus TaxID=2479004 RepID=UPI000F8F2999|nr:YceI family protein [Gynurincola endophyticus]